MGDAERTLEMVRAAGFADPELQEVNFAFGYADFDDVWDAILRSPPRWPSDQRPVR